MNTFIELREFLIFSNKYLQLLYNYSSSCQVQNKTLLSQQAATTPNTACLHYHIYRQQSRLCLC